MKPWRRFALIFLAYGITLLHTAIPHHHHSARPDGKQAISSNHCTPVSSQGLLALVFSTDLGAGHLENFQKNDHAEQVLDFAAALYVAGVLFTHHSLADIVSVQNEIWPFSDNLSTQRLRYSAAGFRAPPALA